MPDHDTAVWLSKSYGLVYLVALSLGVLLYVYWPANRKRFDQAAESIIRDEDRPWR